jgi:ABC-type Fe3+ transport system permease subunit
MLARSTEGALREACADLGDYGKQVGKEVFSSIKKVEVPHNGYLLVGVFLLTFLLISSLGLNCYLGKQKYLFKLL